MESYDKLCEKIRNVIQFQSAIGVVQWDVQTYLPPRALRQRSEQLAVMSKVLHQLIVDPEIGNLLLEVEKKNQSLDNIQQRETELIKRNWSFQTVLPEKIVVALSKQRTISTAKWKQAKSTNNWKLFEPELEKLLAISKERAELLMEPTKTSSPYDAELDSHEPKMTSKMISKLFDDLKVKLIPLVTKYVEKCEDVRIDFKSYKVPVKNQRMLITNLVNYVGFDTITETAGGRIDESEHPFTSSYFDDTRMTVHYNENDITQAIFGGLHEAGHSIQGQSRNPDWKWMFLGEKSSAGINESQARFMENMIGRSAEFWQYYYSTFLDLTNGIFKNIKQDEFVKAINIVKPTKIRVTADELTYALHIIIRYEIELALFSDEMRVSEIPHVWNEKYEKYLGVEIESDTEGALQDTHWAWAYWGYFPTYALGNIYSGMILESLEKSIPDWQHDLSIGSITPVVDWLRENVHYKSNMYYPAEMLNEIAGMKITSEPFISYLEKKYSAIFD